MSMPTSNIISDNWTKNSYWIQKQTNIEFVLKPHPRRINWQLIM